MDENICQCMRRAQNMFLFMLVSLFLSAVSGYSSIFNWNWSTCSPSTIEQPTTTIINRDNDIWFWILFLLYVVSLVVRSFLRLLCIFSSFIELWNKLYSEFSAGSVLFFIGLHSLRMSINEAERVQLFY